MANKPEEKSLLQTIAENTIGLITTAIFSIGLVGGFGFLLFDSQNELNKMAQRNAEIEKQTAEINLGIEMAIIGGSGWYSDNTNGMILGTAIGLLEASLPYDDLDDSFAEKTINWSLMSLEQLNSEDEKIRSYSFTEKALQQSQLATLKVYDTQIILIQEILELSQRWENNNLSERQSQFNVLQLKWIDNKASVSALDSTRSQLYAEKETAIKQSELKLEEIKDDYNSFNARFWLSVAGVMAGLILLFGSIAYLVKKYFQPKEKLQAMPVRKITKSKAKRR